MNIYRLVTWPESNGYIFKEDTALIDPHTAKDIPVADPSALDNALMVPLKDGETHRDGYVRVPWPEAQKWSYRPGTVCDYRHNIYVPYEEYAKAESGQKTSAIVYHRIDFDGICSYAIALKEFQGRGYRVTAFPYSYGDEVPDAQTLCGYDHVLIVDVCLPDDTMNTLMRAARHDPSFRCVWIDHHRSSIRNSVQAGYSLMHGYREETGRAASELTWMYYHENRPVPRAVQYISAYDIHDTERLPWEEEVLPYQYGMRDRYAQRADEFVRDYDEIMESDALTREITATGRIILRFMRESGERGVATYGFPVTVAGTHRGLCCLTNCMGSLPFEARMRNEGCDIAVCVNRLTAKLYKVSMYGSEGNTLDLGAYLKKRYHGGGHFNAAGGTMNLKEFFTLVTKMEI
jgi:oligoribonuclease NrnB/cAMP/cGMP phosphodiesterase (DHH superfamily)